MRERGLALDQLASGAPTASNIGGDDKGRAAVDDRAEAAVDDGVKAVERGTEALEVVGFRHDGCLLFPVSVLD